MTNKSKKNKKVISAEAQSNGCAFCKTRGKWQQVPVTSKDRKQRSETIRKAVLGADSGRAVR